MLLISDGIRFRQHRPSADAMPPNRGASASLAPLEMARIGAAYRNKSSLEDGSFAYEENLEHYLSTHLESIESKLRLFAANGQHGLQYQTSAGRIDLLCIDDNDNVVVIELKLSGTSDQVIGQLARYMGWVEENLAKPRQKIRGIIIAHNISERLRLSAKRLRAELYEYDLRLDAEGHSFILRKRL